MSESGIAHSSGRQGRFELIAGLVCLALCVPLISGATVDAQSRTVIAQTLGIFGVALLLLASGLLPAGMLARQRSAAPGSRAGAGAPAVGPLNAYPSPRDWIVAHARRLRRLLEQVDWRGDWLPVLVPLGLCALAELALATLWTPANSTVPSATSFQVLGGVLIAAAFPLLVLERRYATVSARQPGEAPRIAQLVRVPLLTALALGVASIFRSLGFEWPSLIDRAVVVLLALVAAEIVLRCAATFFLPRAPIAVRDSPARSSIASLIRWERPSLSAINFAVRRQLGIDLSRSWALAFLQRAAIPVLGGMIVASWLLTGVTALGIDQRAVYEEFGVPVGVFGPGIHIHLPWPFGILRNVELGVVHEIPIIFAADEQTAGLEEESLRAADLTDKTGAEDMPPASADRLWDSSHPSEASYLVASNSNGRQNFQIVNIDLRIVYRIGLSDDAARAAVYQTADPEALIRAASGRMLVRHFARYTLFDVLGQNRDAFVRDFKTQLQSRLDALSSGIDVIAVIVEAIHPPPEAASAYQGVQAAQINSIAQIAVSRADAVRKLKSAQQTATATQDDALAVSEERVDQAQADSTLFGGDRQAYSAGGQAFLFERWLDRLNKALSRAPLVVIDHRLGGQNAPTVDLRKLGAPATLPSAETDE